MSRKSFGLGEGDDEVVVEEDEQQKGRRLGEDGRAWLVTGLVGGRACLLEAMWQNWCVRLVGWCVGGMLTQQMNQSKPTKLDRKTISTCQTEFEI